jgi:adenosylhomocysteine nucleosidase
MSAVLLVASDRSEFGGVERRFPGMQPLGWPLDYAGAVERDGQRWLFVANGAGASLAGEAVRTACEKEAVEAMVSTGYCGALDPGLGAADVVVATKVVSPERQYAASEPSAQGRYQRGVMLASERVICSASEKSELREATGAAAVDMESHAVAEEAERAGCRFYCVRVVSDCADESFPFDFNAARDSDGRIRRGAVIKMALRRPLRYVPGLLKLARRSRRAADELGEFLAGCRF